MAISSSVLFMVIFGLMKICLAVYTYHFVAEAAREGSRYASVRGSSCDSTYFSSACPANTDGSDVSAYVKSLNYPGISPSALTVTSSYAAYPSSAVCASTACNDPGDLVTVTVQYAFPLSIPFMPSKIYTMSSTSAIIIAN